MEWFQPEPVKVTQPLIDIVGGHPLTVEIMARRGLSDPAAVQAFLDPAYYRSTAPEELPDVAITVERLLRAIARQERVLVWGDFDVDGQTSTALLVGALKALKAQVSYHVPHRMTEGHGVKPAVLAEKLPTCDLILTCDTGIAAHEAALMARQAGKDFLITDHHALPPTLPDAAAIVNPQRLPAGHPLRDLPGVGVAYKLAQHLFEQAGRAGEEVQFLDLAALGIVADVAQQREETRYLLQLGIERLRSPERAGLKALMAFARVDLLNLSAETIGFQLGPRLNALGRLGDATTAVELLTTDNDLLASQIAAQLEVLNGQRRQIEDQIYAAAQEQIGREPSLLHDYEALVLEQAHWHAGLIGIVASRLVEQYGKPAILLTTDGQVARGSARSVPGVDIGACIAAQAHLLISHGGHPGAAGLALAAEHVPQFRRQLSNTVAATRDPQVRPGYHIDAVLPLANLTEDLARDLERLAPFGSGNPPITLLAHNLKPVGDTAFGVKNKHRRVTLEDEHGGKFELIWWRGGEAAMPDYPIDLLYVPRFSDYRGTRSLQPEWIASRPVPGVEVITGPRYLFDDLRHSGLEGVELPADAVIFAEAQQEMPFAQEQIVNRASLRPAPTLLLWSVPPGQPELEALLAQVRPRRVMVAAKAAPRLEIEPFLKRLAGLVKYALNHYEGAAAMRQLAAASAEREAAVRRGLELLAAQGLFAIEWLPDGALRFSRPGQADQEAIPALHANLHALLAESAAFRAYFSSGPLEAFFK